MLSLGLFLPHKPGSLLSSPCAYKQAGLEQEKWLQAWGSSFAEAHAEQACTWKTLCGARRGLQGCLDALDRDRIALDKGSHRSASALARSGNSAAETANFEKGQIGLEGMAGAVTEHRPVLLEEIDGQGPVAEGRAVWVGFEEQDSGA